MGGKTALFFAKKHPERIKKMVVVDISPFTYTDLDYQKQNLQTHYSIIQELSNIDLKKISSRNQADEALSNNINSTLIRQFLLKNLKRNKDNSYTWKFNLNAINDNLKNIFNGFQSTDNVKISIPTLFIKGKNSNYISSNDIDLIYNTFSNCKIVEIENASHLVHFEQPEIFHTVVIDFLL